MSTRSRRGAKTAPPAAAATAAASPATGEDAEMADAKDAPATAAAGRRASRRRKATPAATEEPDEAESVASESKARSSMRVKRFTRLQAELGEVEEDEAMEEVNPSQHLLDELAGAASLRGGLFSQSSGARPALPASMWFSICDFLNTRSLVQSVAWLSRGGYASAVAYGDVVQTQLAKSAAAAPVKSMPTAASSTRATALGVRAKSDLVLLMSSDLLAAALPSHLRTLIVHVRTPPLDKPMLARVVAAMPQLRTLDCIVFNPKAVTMKDIEPLDFPRQLRTLHLRLLREGRVERFPAFCCSALARISDLERLEEFLVESDRALHYDYRSFQTSWLAGLARLPRLHTLTLKHVLLSLPMVAWLREQHTWLRHLMLDNFAPGRVNYVNASEPETHFPAVLAQLAVDTPEDPFRLRLETFNLAAWQGFELTEQSIAALEKFAGCLLECRTSSQLTDVTRLGALARLEKFALHPINLSRVPGGNFNFQPQAPLQVAIEPQTVVLAVQGMPRLRELELTDIALTDAQLASLLAVSAPLTRLVLQGATSITSLAPLSASPHLREKLEHLTIKLPALPRAEVAYIHQLRGLCSLSILGSFAEPLYASQLLPFKWPYPSRLHPRLARFIARSANEVVPPEPIDLQAKAAAVADFDSRVRHGAVAAAEKMNASQLSIIFQFLDCKDFSVAGRSCRSWRNAASLPSAWGLSGSADFGRVLTQPVDSLRFSRYVLPYLPLWQHLRALHWAPRTPSGPGREFGSVAPSLETIGFLPRLESLEMDLSCVPAGEPAFSTAMQRIAPRLRHLSASSAGLHPLGELTQLRSLVLISYTGQNLPLASMPHLQRLSISTLDSNDLAARVRKQSLTGELRSFTLRGAPDWGLQPAAVEVAEAQLREFLLQLAGHASGDAFASGAPPTEPPAALTELDLRLRPKAEAQLPLAAVATLPKLRMLTIEDQARLLTADLSPLEDLVKQSRLTQLESLRLCGVLVAPAHVAQLRRFSQLRVLALAASTTTDGPGLALHGKFKILPGDIAKLLQALPLLEEFTLREFSFDPSELATLASMEHLHTLRLGPFADALAPASLDFLPSCARLHTLVLDRLSGVLLLRRDWMEKVHAKIDAVLGALEGGEGGKKAAEESDAKSESEEAGGEEEKEKEQPAAMEIEGEAAPPAAVVAADAAAPSALPPPPPSAYSDLLHVLSLCRRLSDLVWKPAYRLQELVDYSTVNSRFFQMRHCLSTMMGAWIGEQEQAREREALRGLMKARNAVIAAAAAAAASHMHDDDKSGAPATELPEQLRAFTTFGKQSSAAYGRYVDMQHIPLALVSTAPLSAEAEFLRAAAAAPTSLSYQPHAQVLTPARKELLAHTYANEDRVLMENFESKERTTTFTIHQARASAAAPKE